MSFSEFDSVNVEEVSGDSALTLEQYQSLQVHNSMTRSSDFSQSVKELAVLFQEVFSDIQKPVQNALFNDALTAVRTLPRMEKAANLNSTRFLIKLGSAVLPKKKKGVLLSEFKVALIERQRLMKRRNSNVAIADESSESDTEASMLPLDTIRLIFSFLDAPTLAISSCVCKLWNSLSQDDSLWEFHFKRLELPKKTSRIKADHIACTEKIWRKEFYKQIKLTPFRVRNSNRAYCNQCHSFFWLDPKSWKDNHDERSRCTRGMPHSLIYPCAEQVVRILLGKISESSSDKSDDSDSNSGFFRYS